MFVSYSRCCSLLCGGRLIKWGKYSYWHQTKEMLSAANLRFKQIFAKKPTAVHVQVNTGAECLIHSLPLIMPCGISCVKWHLLRVSTASQKAEWSASLDIFPDFPLWKYVVAIWQATSNMSTIYYVTGNLKISCVLLISISHWAELLAMLLQITKWPAV